MVMPGSGKHRVQCATMASEAMDVGQRQEGEGQEEKKEHKQISDTLYTRPADADDHSFRTLFALDTDRQFVQGSSRHFTAKTCQVGAQVGTPFGTEGF